MRVVLTGGGTGGHAYPAISIAEALRSEFPECELLYVGGRDSIEARLAEAAGIAFSGLTSRRLTRPLSGAGALTFASLAKGAAQAWLILKKFGPDVVVGTGGYASAAVVLAQVLRRGRTLIHEQNVIPGRTNLWLGRFASKVCVAFEDSLGRFPSGKATLTGLPVRADLLNAPGRAESRAALGLKADVFTVLVLGGSQGARRLNQVVGESIPELRQLPVQVLHQSGERNYEEAETTRESAGWDDYHVRPYLHDMGPAYSVADLVVCRCGASTIAEITALGLPAILVPYPYAYADHQWHNGMFVARNGGGVVIGEVDLDARALVHAIEELVESPAQLKQMAEESKKLGRPDAAREIVRIVGSMI